MSQFPNNFNYRRIIQPTVPSSNSSQNENNLSSFHEYEIGYVDEDEEEFETPKEQLEYALEDDKSAIIIRDKSLGIRTVIWIVLGKSMRYLAVVTAIGSIVCSCGAPEELLDVAKPLAMSSLVLNLGYYSVWHRSPLMKYKPIQHYSLIRAVNQQHQLPTILVRKPMTCTKYLNIGTCALALLAAFWGDFKPLDFFQDFKNPFTSTVEESPPQEKTMKEAVKEVFDRHNFSKFSIAEVSHEDPLRSSEEQLSDALSARRSVVIIKDKEYGRRILLWMAFGRGVHKSALAMATGSILCATVMNEKFLVFAKPLAVGSLVLNIAYHLTWHRTPLMHYRIAPQCSVLQAVKNDVKTNTIIVEKTVEYRTDIACSISVVASTLAFWRGIKSLNFPDKLFRFFKKLGPEP